jgi:hypothetical protein
MLSGAPGTRPEQVVERLLAVQGQDPRGFRLALRARSSGLSAGDVDAALSKRRSLVVNWLARGTLHLVRSDDHAWLHALTTPQLLRTNATRLAQEGVSAREADRAVALIERSLLEDGPLTRRQLAERLAGAGLLARGQALVHLLLATCLRGIALRGPLAGREQAYVLVRDWLGEPQPVDREQALAELARRYLAGHAPADERDLARWAGIRLGDARRGLKAIVPSVRGDGLLEPRSQRRSQQPLPLPAPRLLGAFDPLLHGWVSRETVLGVHAAKVVSGGVFRPFALVRGRAVATWRLERERVVLEPFKRIAGEETAALRQDGEDVLRYLESDRRAST